eukprot:RCo042543
MIFETGAGWPEGACSSRLSALCLSPHTCTRMRVFGELGEGAEGGTKGASGAVKVPWRKWEHWIGLCFARSALERRRRLPLAFRSLAYAVSPCESVGKEEEVSCCFISLSHCRVRVSPLRPLSCVKVVIGCDEGPQVQAEYLRSDVWWAF